MQFDEAGTYTVYYRARGFDGGSNSFLTPEAFGADPTAPLPMWAVFFLEFNIGKREAGAELDAFVFHLDNGLSDSELDALIA